MLRRFNPLIISLVVCLSLVIASLPAAASAGKPAIGSVVVPKDANQTPAFPYVAQVIGDKVQVRSGPGANYYVCGQLNKNDIVRVVSQKTGWNCIMPPAGSFSWVAKQYVELNKTNPAESAITTDSVNVRAGNTDGSPYHSSTVQGTFNKGDKVALTGEERDDYYKIAPPPFAYFWVSSELLKTLGPDETAGKTTTSVIDTNSPEARYLQQYYALEKMFKTESDKPLLSQDYSKIKPALDLIASNPKAGKAARLAQYILKRIADAETAVKVQSELAVQDKQMKQVMENIAKAAQLREAELPNLGRFAVIGKFRASAIYGEQTRYQVLDSQGNILCFAIPEGAAAQTDLTKFMNKNVGLVGIIEPNPQTQGALVRFTEIAELPQ
jgi:uncharacterized protein YgiM (DUF1202 family)